MSLTLKDVEHRGLLNELANSFDTQAAAVALLAKLDVQPGQFQSFNSMAISQWWRHVCQELDKGLIKNGLERLLRAAADIFPGNEKFQEYLEPRSQPNNRSANQANIRLNLPGNISDDLALEIIHLARRAVAQTGKSFEVNMGTEGSSRFHISVEGGDDEDVERIRREVEQLGRERGVDVEVTREEHDFRDYYTDPLTAEGPDTRRFALDQMRASTPVKDVARGVMSSYDDKTSQAAGGGTRQHAVVDHLTPEGSVRLDPRKTLHDSGVRPGETLRVAPERTAGAVHPLMREEALARARVQVLDHAAANSPFEVEANSLVAPTEYVFRFSAAGFAPPPAPGAPPVPITEHAVYLELPPDFPIKAPEAWWQTEIYHPNIDPNNGWVCLGALQEQYRPGLDFGELCKMLVDIAAYRTYTLTEGFNEDAARWALSPEGQIAIERAGGFSVVGRIVTDGQPSRPVRIREVDL